jgi:uncharacterized protein (TIGR03086 family)
VSQNLRIYTKALYGFDAVVQRVPADRWDAQSPCDGWCARDVVAHAAGVVDSIAQMARTGEVAFPETPDAGNDPVGLWNTALDGVLEALDHPDALSQVGNFWFGESSIDDIVAFTTWDPLGHSWDLARSVGLEAHTSEDVIKATIPVIEKSADTLRAMHLMGDPVVVPADADAMTASSGSSAAIRSAKRGTLQQLSAAADGSALSPARSQSPASRIIGHSAWSGPPPVPSRTGTSEWSARDDGPRRAGDFERVPGSAWEELDRPIA